MKVERFRNTLIPFLIFFLFTPALFFYPQEIKADTASCAGGLASGLLGGTVVGKALGVVPTSDSLAEGNTFGTMSYDCILKPIAISMAQRMLANITNSLVNWIQGGFNGNPAFVTNMGDFLSNTADQAIGQFIQNDPSLSLLCQPFSAQIRIALATEFSTEQYQGCTLTQVNKNISDFGNTFDAWNQWLQVTTIPANNQWGAYIQEEGLLSDKINGALADATGNVNRNGGFLDIQKCDQWEDVNTSATSIPGLPNPYNVGTPVAGAPGTTEECTHYITETPGTAVSNALGASYQTDLNKIGLATDIDQVIGALVNELISTTITGPNGLLGSGTPSASISNTADLSTVAAGQSASNAQVISDLNSQVNTGQNQAFSAATLSNALSTSTSTFFSNPYPTDNPINLTASSIFPTFSVQSTLSNQVAGLQAVITLKSENPSYTPSQIFDTSIYALYIGDSTGTIVNADTSYSLIRNGSITLQNLPSSVASFQFNLRPIVVNQNPRLPIYNTYDLTITIEDGNGQVLATQTAKFRMLVN